MPFEMVRNDITRMKVDAVVNAANASLLGGGGVDGAIHAAAGPGLLEECRALGGCLPGQAKITKGYNLPARYVIHTVGPVWEGGKHGERDLLASCYLESLRLAYEYRCASVAFPMISTGAYGYPRDEALQVAVQVISGFLLQHDMTIYLVVFGRESLFSGKKLFRDIQSYIDDVYVSRHLDYNRESRRAEAVRAQRKAALPDAEAPLLAEGAAAPLFSNAAPACAAPKPDLDELLRGADESFSQTLMRMIDERGMTDAECYHRANMDRRLFSRIRSHPDYRPSKPTVLALAVALRLNLRETKLLLERAGFALSHSSPFDIILEYFILHRNYDIYQINEILFEYDLPLLGNSAAP